MQQTEHGHSPRIWGMQNRDYAWWNWREWEVELTFVQKLAKGDEICELKFKELSEWMVRSKLRRKNVSESWERGFGGKKTEKFSPYYPLKRDFSLQRDTREKAFKILAQARLFRPKMFWRRAFSPKRDTTRLSEYIRKNV